MSTVNGENDIQCAMTLACRWLTDVCQVTSVQATDTRNPFPLANMRGAFREYNQRTRQWEFFGPHWHTGQAIKALVMAHRRLKDNLLLAAAGLGMEFIGTNRIAEGDDTVRGLLLTWEGTFESKVRIPGIFETLDGVIAFAEYTQQEKWWPMITGALDWLVRNAWVQGEGLFRNVFDPETGRFVSYAMTKGFDGKPTLDGAVFVKAYRKTGKQVYKRVAIDVADRLLADEKPRGNWIDYGPSSAEFDRNHPRQAFWYGYPMLEVYDLTREDKYLDQAIRSAEWYMNAQRTDGGIFRVTRTDFNTTSFGHAASAAAGAAIMWIDLWRRLDDDRYVPYIRRAFDFLLTMQVRKSSDSNMAGCIIEKVLPPDGTDASPYMVRDLATIFFVQAACMLLDTAGLCEKLGSKD